MPAPSPACPPCRWQTAPPQAARRASPVSCRRLAQPAAWPRLPLLLSAQHSTSSSCYSCPSGTPRPALLLPYQAKATLPLHPFLPLLLLLLLSLLPLLSPP